jgi:F-type H+-transporting ATPase subunit delta
MNESKISVRYAKALFTAAAEAKVLPQVMQDMEILMRVYSIEDFRNVLDSPVVKTSEKKKVTNSLFSGNISDLSMRFIDLMLSNKRESFLPHIARNFQDLYKKEKGIVSAELVLPEKIKGINKEKFVDLLKKTYKSEIQLEEVIRPEILGGFILRVEDEQYDASVASELSNIKKQLLESTSVK